MTSTKNLPYRQTQIVAKEQAIQAAQEELLSLRVQGTVVDVHRAGQGPQAIIVLSDGRQLRVNGYVAIKLSAMLRSNYQRWRRYVAPGERTKAQ